MGAIAKKHDSNKHLYIVDIPITLTSLLIKEQRTTNNMYCLNLFKYVKNYYYVQRINSL